MESEQLAERNLNPNTSPQERSARHNPVSPELIELRRRIQDLFSTNEVAARWFMNASYSLDFERPVDRIKAGDVSSVLSVIEKIESGIFL